MGQVEGNGEASETRPARRRKHWWRLLVIVLLTYVGVCMVVAWLQARLIYFPTREYPQTPADIGLEFEDLTLQTRDGERIAAWYVAAPEKHGSIIFCHGNAGNISDRLHVLRQLHHLGYNALIFDYRGYGRSTGSSGEAGTYLDAEAAWDYLVNTRGEAPGRIVLFGRSLGGAVAIELARRHPPAGLVVECTFTSLVDVARVHYPLLPVSLILVHRYESVGKVPEITCPKLFIHGRDDELIPFAQGQALYEAAAFPKQFMETPGGHNEAGFDYSDEHLKRVQAFLADALRGQTG